VSVEERWGLLEQNGCQRVTVPAIPCSSQLTANFGENSGEAQKLLGRHYFHLHLISDATGETLIAASRAAAAQYEGVSCIEHVYPLVRSSVHLDKALVEIEV
jgi:Kinase/pyrophosphorylase